jgi:hypothetical protein
MGEEVETTSRLLYPSALECWQEHSSVLQQAVTLPSRLMRRSPKRRDTIARTRGGAALTCTRELT